MSLNVEKGIEKVLNINIFQGETKRTHLALV